MSSYHSVLNVKTLIDAFNQEKALVGAFSVIVNSSRSYVCSSSGGGWWDGSRDQVHLVDPVSCYISRLAATLHRDVSDIRASVVKYIYTISTRGLV